MIDYMTHPHKAYGVEIAISLLKCMYKRADKGEA